MITRAKHNQTAFESNATLHINELHDLEAELYFYGSRYKSIA